MKTGLLKNVYRAGLGALPLPVSRELQFLKAHRRLPRRREPMAFNDHLHRCIGQGGKPVFATLADKLQVKDFVADRLGSHWTTPTLWSGKKFPRDFEWTTPFIIKANHASNWNHFVRSREDFDPVAIARLVEKWVSTPWHGYLGENWYNQIDRHALIEPLIGGDELLDYKFYVFGGRVECVQVDFDRHSEHKQAFYSRNWEKQDFSHGYPASASSVPRPVFLSTMIDAAQELAKGFSFVRVDLYELAEGPRFGEMTFTPGAGYVRFYPEEADRRLGKLWPSSGGL